MTSPIPSPPPHWPLYSAERRVVVCARGTSFSWGQLHGRRLTRDEGRGDPGFARALRVASPRVWRTATAAAAVALEVQTHCGAFSVARPCGRCRPEGGWRQRWFHALVDKATAVLAAFLWIAIVDSRNRSHVSYIDMTLYVAYTRSLVFPGDGGESALPFDTPQKNTFVWI